MSRSLLFAVRASIVILVTLVATTTTRAGFVSSTPDPFLGSAFIGRFAMPIQTPIGFVSSFNETNFVETSNVITGGNDVINYTATYITPYYTSADLTTISVIGSVPVVFSVTVFGRTSPFQTGNFNYQITSQSSTGVTNGTTLSSQLNPTIATLGTVSIVPIAGTANFLIDSPDVDYSQYSINGSPFVNAAGVSKDTFSPSSVPEPASLAMTLIGSALAGLGYLRRRRNASK